MRIQNNISALNSNRIFNKNKSKLSKTLEKLSSGYQINRSADNAAGLAVSEKMRSIILGLDQAEQNSVDAISLIQTAEGALQEVHTILERMKQLSVQSANGEYNDGVDRAALQLEFEQLQDEIEHISTHTDFNNMMLFDGTGGTDYFSKQGNVTNQNPITLEELLNDDSNELKNIIYTETVYDFDTTQTADGSVNAFNAAYQTIADELQTAVVPQVVTSIMDTYTAFSYLTGSSIGIGLELYSDAGSSTLAAVSLGTAYTNDGNGNYEGAFLTYSLKVNVASVDLDTAEGRSALEQTIAHEMIHAFMDEALTAGMTGITGSGPSSSEKFPMWFVEGMAQTASGPGNWTRGGSIGLDENSSAAEITAALGGGNALATNSTAAQYGTGYLACMYLGHLASGGNTNMDNPTAAAAGISAGVSSVLSKLVNGDSLDSVINDVTGGKYADIAAFESGFANDSDAISFVQKLLKYTSNETNGNVGGGLVGGSLANTDPVADTDISGLKLFALDTDNTAVKNQYPSEVTILSGGTSSSSGSAPVGSITPPTPPPVTPTYPSNVFTVTGGTEGVDWEFDDTTGTLNILSDATLEISGGTVTDSNGTYYGNIVIGNGVNTKLTLRDVDIDASKRGGTAAGIDVGVNSDVIISIEGTTNIKGGGTAAGIQLNDNDGAIETNLTIDIGDTAVLNVTGGTSSSKGGAAIGAGYGYDAAASNINIQGGGELNAYGGYGSAAIGASGHSGNGGDIGDITIDGGNGVLNILAVGGDHGAGIGGAWYGAAGDITIKGKADIDASSKSHGTGIGGGCHGASGNIVIGDVGGSNSDLIIKADGGDDGAAIGAGWDSTTGDITINSGTITAIAGSEGAGIGSGYQADVGTISINGGIITAEGSTNASGIGGGRNGTIKEVVISGGEITANGGWTNDGGNIGGYTDSSGTTKAEVKITDPNGLTIKAGSGEGKYITTGSKDGNGNDLYALDISYINDLLADGDVTLAADGSDPSSLSFPLASVTATTADGTSYSWNDLQHMNGNSAYIWMKGQDITLTFTDADGTEGTVDLKFFDDYGMWRFDNDDLPDELPKEPGYVVPNPPTPPTPDPKSDNIWVMQTGARTRNTFLMDIGIMNTKVLGVDKDSVSIETQKKANEAIDIVDNAINEVSMQRADLGAYQNRLEHKIDNLNVSLENLQAAESGIRDADMAKYMMEFNKNQVLINASQAMLAQANNFPEGILSLLQ